MDQTTDHNQPTLSVVILCYRAGESTRDFVQKMIAVLQKDGINDYELVLVGNYHQGSNDTTPQVVQALASQNPRITTVAMPKQGMMGWDMRSGLDKANGIYITVIDGDGQMPVEDVTKVYQKITAENLDLVKTIRIVRGDGAWRKFISYVYNTFFKILFPGLNATDINAKPKILRRESLLQMKLTANDWFIDAEIMIQARRLKLRIGEVPTNFLGLTGRKSFVKPHAILEFVSNLVRYRFKEWVSK